MILSVLNQKGGVGKTTLSVSIASALALNGKKVLLIDADAQRSALDWFNAREEEPLFSVVGIPSNTLHKQIKLLKPDYDYIVIDGPPRVYDVAKACIASSDMVIIPIQPSPYDVWSAEEIVNLVKEVQDTLVGYKRVEMAFVINRKIANTLIGNDVEEALKKYDIPVVSTPICQRVAYAETVGRGTSPIEEDPDSVAGKEMKKLVEEVVKLHRELSGSKTA